MTQKSDEEKAGALAQEVFRKCFLVMLAHIQRRIADDPSYEEPRFLRAFLVAFEGISNPEVKNGQTFMGVATSKNPTEAYAVVLEKRSYGMELIELRDLARNKAVGQREIMRLMQLTILLDNLPDEPVRWSKALEILNGSIPGVKFVKFPNNQWRKYRTLELQEIWNGKIPQISPNSEMTKKLRAATSFSEVPQIMRTGIGTLYAANKFPGRSVFSITSPDKTVDRWRIFEIAKDTIYGYGAEHLKPMDLPKN
jgi:hypothetical protein